jgi:hypothetical protein
MNRNTTYAMFGVTFALVAGLLGTNLLSAESSGLAAQDSKSSDGMFLMGHVTTIVKDKDGNIKAYRQGDNAVSNNGKNCVAKYLFAAGSTRGATASTSGVPGLCVGALTAPFTAIAIGNGSSAPTVANADIKLGKEMGGNGMDRQLGTVTWTNATASASATVLIQGTFGPWTAGTASTTVIQEAGLFNSTTDNATTGGMFAHVLVPSPPTLNNGDSVTIKYTVNMG